MSLSSVCNALQYQPADVFTCNFSFFQASRNECCDRHKLECESCACRHNITFSSGTTIANQNVKTTWWGCVEVLQQSAPLLWQSGTFFFGRWRGGCVDEQMWQVKSKWLLCWRIWHFGTVVLVFKLFVLIFCCSNPNFGILLDRCSPAEKSSRSGVRNVHSRQAITKYTLKSSFNLCHSSSLNLKYTHLRNYHLKRSF